MPTPGATTPDVAGTITELVTHDIRFPTSQFLDGSDAMNPDPDYSAAYVEIRTDAGDGLSGNGFVFTIGRGNDVQLAAIESLRPYLVGRSVAELLADPGQISAELIGDSQLRWLGPEKGVMHMAIGAVVNALWDLRAKRAGLPLWQLLSSLPPQELVALVDFRYLSDALTPDEALEILQRAAPGRQARAAQLMAEGYPAYTTTPGWLGYDDEKLVRLTSAALAEGFAMIKLKVGADLDDDRRRMRLAREVVGPDFPIATDANQRWDVDAAVQWMQALAEFDPYWIEEPTSPDDILGHAEIRRRLPGIKVVTGEHVQNRIMFKQLLQAGALDAVQIDATRVGGIDEILAILLLAAKFEVPVCPHAGGVGLCELVRHLAMFDFVAVSGSWEGRAIEFADHLHEHFADPARIARGRYVAPTAPGFSADLVPGVVAEFSYPNGGTWAPTLVGLNGARP